MPTLMSAGKTSRFTSSSQAPLKMPTQIDGEEGWGVGRDYIQCSKHAITLTYVFACFLPHQQLPPVIWCVIENTRSCWSYDVCL